MGDFCTHRLSYSEGAYARPNSNGTARRFACSETFHICSTRGLVVSHKGIFFQFNFLLMTVRVRPSRKSYLAQRQIFFGSNTVGRANNVV